MGLIFCKSVSENGVSPVFGTVIRVKYNHKERKTQRRTYIMKRKAINAAVTLAGAATIWLGGWAGLWLITGIMKLLNL